MALEKSWKESLFSSSAVSPNFKMTSLELFSFQRKLSSENYHLRLKVLNIFSVISYHTEKSTNLLSLSECFEPGKEVVIHQKQFYYEI